MKPNELEAGPELDKAVADALGFKVCFDETWQLSGDGKHQKTDYHVVHPETFERFSPSSDLNAAFEAAEKVGLFESWLLGECGGVWFLQDYSERVMVGIIDSHTPQLAICRAILKLKGGHE